MLSLLFRDGAQKQPAYPKRSSSHPRGRSGENFPREWPPSPSGSLSSSWTSGPVFVLPLNAIPTSKPPWQIMSVAQAEPHTYMSFPPYPNEDEYDIEAQVRRRPPQRPRSIFSGWLETPTRWLNSLKDAVAACPAQWRRMPKAPTRRE